MTEEENKTVARRLFEEVFSEGNLNAVDELVAPESIGHAPPDELRGPDGVKQFVSAFRAAFPDLRITIEDLIAEGDKVVVRWIARGTHEGGFNGIPPTGERIEMPGITIERIENGQIVEGWTNRDSLGMLRQLGVLEQPAADPRSEP